jgi:hypothetical protein
LDGSWQVDIAYNTFLGSWLDRNVIFTYGPLYQLLTSLPSIIFGFSTGFFFSTITVVFFWAAILLTFFTAKLLLRSEPAWKRSIFLALVVIFWSSFEIRLATELFLFALFLQLVDGMVTRHRSIPWAAGSCGISLICAFMLSADTGMYSALAIIIVMAVAAALNWKSVPVLIRLLLFGMLSLVVFAVLGIAINVVLGGGPFAYRFLREGYELVSVYRWIVPFPMSSLDARVFGWTVGTGFFIIAAAWFWRDSHSEATTRRPLFLLSAALFAFVLLQSGLVRSDWGHILMGLSPIVFFALSVLIGTGSAPILRASLCLFVAIGITAIAAGPFPSFIPKNVIANYSFHPGLAATNCQGVYLDHACFSVPAGRILSATSAFLQEHTAATDSVLIFPYENEAGVAARRLVAGGVLQNYLIGGDYLTRRQLDGFEFQRPSHGLYFANGSGIDGVTDFSRTPLVWLYMQSHYVAVAELTPGVFALVRDESRAVRQQSSPLVATARSVAITGTDQTIDLGAVRWPQGAEFLKLRLTVHYSPVWKVRKPARLTVEVELADGTRKRTNLVVPPNQASEVWVYPGDEENLGQFFSSEEAIWPDQRAPVVRIRIIVTKMDWVSLMPAQVTVEKAEVISLLP